MCSFCSAIPDRLTVDTVHDPERLPEAVGRLEVVDGDVWDRQLRRCPECSAFFAYTRDHDSESGVGYGYTDETIERLWSVDSRLDGTCGLRNVSVRVTGDMLSRVIRALNAKGSPSVESITTLSVEGGTMGPAPEEIGWLTSLDVLSLHDCGLSSLPKAIGRLHRLTQLWITGNPLTELPVEILNLPLAQVELQNTRIVELPDAFLASAIRFLYYEGNAVPEPWRPMYTCEPAYRGTLKWFIDRGARCLSFASGAWSHEDRFELALSLPASALAVGTAFPPEGSPFQVVARNETSLVLQADGRGGVDRIDVQLVESVN